MAEVEIKKLEKQIAEKEEQMKNLQPNYQKLLEEDNRLNSDIRIIDQRCKELYGKQGHREQYKTVEERDKYLKNEIRWIDGQIYETNNQINEIDGSIQKEDEENEALRERFQV